MMYKDRRPTLARCYHPSTRCHSYWDLYRLSSFCRTHVPPQTQPVTQFLLHAAHGLFARLLGLLDSTVAASQRSQTAVGLLPIAAQVAPSRGVTSAFPYRLEGEGSAARACCTKGPSGPMSRRRRDATVSASEGRFFAIAPSVSPQRFRSTPSRASASCTRDCATDVAPALRTTKKADSGGRMGLSRAVTNLAKADRRAIKRDMMRRRSGWTK